MQITNEMVAKMTKLVLDLVNNIVVKEEQEHHMWVPTLYCNCFFKHVGFIVKMYYEFQVNMFSNTMGIKIKRDKMPLDR